MTYAPNRVTVIATGFSDEMPVKTTTVKKEEKIEKIDKNSQEKIEIFEEESDEEREPFFVIPKWLEKKK